jgi:hypothetical protein
MWMCYKKQTNQTLILMHKFRKLFITSHLKMNVSLSPGNYIDDDDEMEGG